jgi:hypothetical protein
MGYWIQKGLSPTAAKKQAWAAVADVKNGMVAHSASALAFLQEAFPDPDDTNGNV